MSSPNHCRQSSTSARKSVTSFPQTFADKRTTDTNPPLQIEDQGRVRNLLKQFTGRTHTPLVQFIKYAIAGGIATVVHIILFYAGALMLMPALTSNDPVAKLLHVHSSLVSDTIRARNYTIDYVLAFIFSNLTAYLINIFWVFESGRHNRVSEIFYFYVVSSISTVVGVSLADFLIHHFSMMTTFAFASNAVVSLLINFLLRKYFVFKG